MSSVSLETCWAIKKCWNNKFYYTVTSCWLFLYDLYYDARIHEHQVYKASCLNICMFWNWVLGYHLKMPEQSFESASMKQNFPPKIFGYFPIGTYNKCTWCSPKVMHTFLLWLYKSCCCNHASGGRGSWPWAWRQPPVSLQGPVHSNSNVVSVSDYFHTDNYGVLTRRAACHNKILWKLC